jgi:hypothetical protein
VAALREGEGRAATEGAAPDDRDAHARRRRPSRITPWPARAPADVGNAYAWRGDLGRVRALAVLLLATGSLAGCLEVPVDCPVPESLRPMTPVVPAPYGATDPAQEWDALVLRPAAEADWTVDAQPEGWRARLEQVSPALDRVRVEPAAATGAPGNVTLRWHVRAATDAGCVGERTGYLHWALAAPEAGAKAQAGAGAQVMTAGFWENGTLFYTNIQEVHESAWPRAGWYAWAGSDPLPVYVYDRARGEQPAWWSAGTGGTPLGPATGNATLWQYYTTIPGFNEALKGLSTNTARVVRLAPEEAYTRSGNERHPLYGDALVFYVKVVGVDPAPCPGGMLAAACPGLPLASPAPPGPAAAPAAA